MIGLPGTIDNDIACTDYTIGFDTAMNTALEMIDKLLDTTQSHDRCSVVEVMGRNAGYIALNVAIASGAMAVLLPEREFDMQRDILDKIIETQRTGKRHFVVIVAEGIGHSQEIASEIQARTGIDTRATILAMFSAVVRLLCGSCQRFRYGLSGCLPAGAGQVQPHRRHEGRAAGGLPCG